MKGNLLRRMKMNKKEAVDLNVLLKKTSEAENTLLVKRNKNLSKNLRKFIKYKRKIAEFEQQD